ncbi:hypothetical protein SETIT_1G276700v2 [Setaria italica]|uniref:Uncharacterized protein n=2 Tax=Setaria TaxID=4554 RepID=A0A368PPV7_SETIT|nr:hypothetical protein SETIT_1G276700v2 [Setaria italica]TKW40967.1 hypothetical protein SEVIR_1G282200v2 [Setaria viridis]
MLVTVVTTPCYILAPGPQFVPLQFWIILIGNFIASSLPSANLFGFGWQRRLRQAFIEKDLLVVGLVASQIDIWEQVPSDEGDMIFL